ncbi:hypothetical protein RJ639_019118 [Escallonia herrerae]|uniref:Uncharacterized protein n=1 Tax=Escallonia herrerae TaxID=1293975 RepID=A0AA88V9K5_9ASTE|nr:hypothetical protein RJ639_019118 [Escallonia herrerae]
MAFVMGCQDSKVKHLFNMCIIPVVETSRSFSFLLIIPIFLQAVEMLWTPQNENDTLSERELLEDYPLLRPL